MGAIIVLLGFDLEGCDCIGIYLGVNIALFLEGCVDIRVMRAVLLIEVAVYLRGTSD